MDKDTLSKILKSQRLLNEIVTEHNTKIVEHDIKIVEHDTKIKKQGKSIDRLEKVTLCLNKEIESLKKENRNLQMQIDKRDGLSYSEIGKKYSISKSRVGQILKD
ncbi:MAG: hypothetical protein ACRCZO_02765 [Cetobacterium sp.]